MSKKLHWEDFEVGFFGSFGPITVTREDILDFAREFDPQPMHLDEDAARDSMLGGLAASGWQCCAFLTRLMVDGWLLNSTSMGSPGVEEVKWVTPLRPGDVITLKATITSKRASRSRPEMGICFFDLEMVNQRGECVMTLKNTQLYERRHHEVEPSAETAKGGRA